eukprot:CAMPEP_0179909072 /NCGR_PEP_ID=MMETSP0982-20121206/45010_1 /TAXON_ID=483367 /ORGANISM="non described non described, Strain CCMP 2436" /LENGTH=84 /DNA_ID=CAMNT_0021810477 /DNA_START=580 /DNA_END=834 /DNA_ORIENTATION=+
MPHLASVAENFFVATTSAGCSPGVKMRVTVSGSRSATVGRSNKKRAHAKMAGSELAVAPVEPLPPLSPPPLYVARHPPNEGPTM